MTTIPNGSITQITNPSAFLRQFVPTGYGDVVKTMHAEQSRLLAIARTGDKAAVIAALTKS